MTAAATGADVASGTTHSATRSAGIDQLRVSFKRALVAVRKLRGRETHRPGQMSNAQYELLFGLSAAGDVSARELASQVDLTPATVAQMLDHLESAGLVERTRSDGDRRVVLSALTPRGQSLVAERRAQMEPRWLATLDEFTAAELVTAARVIGRLADYFDLLLDEVVTES